MYGYITNEKIVCTCLKFWGKICLYVSLLDQQNVYYVFMCIDFVYIL